MAAIGVLTQQRRDPFDCVLFRFFSAGICFRDDRALALLIFKPALHRTLDDPSLVRRTAIRQAHPATCDRHLLDIIAEASAIALIDHGFFGDESWGGGAEDSVCGFAASGLMAILGSTTGGVTTESGWGTVSGCLTMPGSVGLGTVFARGASVAGGCLAAGGEESGAGTMSAAKAGGPMRIRVNRHTYNITITLSPRRGACLLGESPALLSTNRKPTSALVSRS